MFCLVSVLLSFGTGLVLGDQNAEGAEPKRVIFIDPGHGGSDNGVRGANGALEKNINFVLAQQLSHYLKKNYSPLFSRTGDYRLPLFKRSEAANHERADLFVSIHTGGSFRHQTNRLTIYVFQDAKENEFSKEVAGNSQARYTPWSHVQLRHVSSSRRLATHIQHILNNEINEVSCQVRTAPLVVLSGVDMPAVLIEIGHLTNPLEERRLTDSEYLSRLAGAVGQGIDNFLANTSTIFSIDLRE